MHFNLKFTPLSTQFSPLESLEVNILASMTLMHDVQSITFGVSRISPDPYPTVEMKTTCMLDGDSSAHKMCECIRNCGCQQIVRPEMYSTALLSGVR